MATIINNPGETSEGSGGWAVAVIILLVVIAIGGFAWMRYHGGGTPAPAGATVQVNLPTGGSDNGGAPAAQ
jgi:hypothetical protein